MGSGEPTQTTGAASRLGFDTAILEDGFVKSSTLSTGGGQTFRVVYNDKVAAKLHSDIIDKMFHLISLPHGKKLDSKSLHEYMGELLVLTCMHCLRAALFFKHEAYANEAEYRFLQNPYGGRRTLRLSLNIGLALTSWSVTASMIGEPLLRAH